MKKEPAYYSINYQNVLIFDFITNFFFINLMNETFLKLFKFSF